MRTRARFILRYTGTGPRPNAHVARLRQVPGAKVLRESDRMLLVEGGRLDEITINDDKAEVKVLKEGLTGITAVTLAGKTAYVAEAKLNLRNDATKDPGPFRAIGVPYTAAK